MMKYSIQEYGDYGPMLMEFGANHTEDGWPCMRGTTEWRGRTKSTSE